MQHHATPRSQPRAARRPRNAGISRSHALRVATRIARRGAFSLATSDPLERLVHAVRPLEALAYRGAQRYVAGRDEQSALAVVHALSRQGFGASVDLFGENLRDAAQADIVTTRYLRLVTALATHADTHVSLDCSHLGLDHDPDGCCERVKRIARALPDGARLQLGAEDIGRTDATLQLARAVAGDGLPVMATIQANLRRSASDVPDLAQAQVSVRLVKGAYVESKRVAHPWGPETDTAYFQLAQQLQTLGVYHSLATHDSELLRRVLVTHERAEIEFLLGVHTEKAHHLAKCGHHVRIYVPYGERWFRYYARRVVEAIGA